MPALFDHYVIVDWSAAARPKTGPRQHLDLPPGAARGEL